jgi:hypothetical protein
MAHAEPPAPQPRDETLRTAHNPVKADPKSHLSATDSNPTNYGPPSDTPPTLTDSPPTARVPHQEALKDLGVEAGIDRSKIGERRGGN